MGRGRRRCVDTDPRLGPDLDQLVHPVTRGDPVSVWWTARSAEALARALPAQEHRRSGPQRYRFPAPRQRREGNQHPDRDAQFRHIATQATTWPWAGGPVISVDAQKKV